MSGFSPALFGRSPPLPSALSAPAAEISVIGGDTLRLRGSVIRLAGLVAPQRGEACRIAPVVDCGRAAAAALAALVRGRGIVCALHGADRLGRPFAHCRAAGRDLNRAIVLAGWARTSGAWPALRRAEVEARTAHRGTWAALR
ncbi:MAG TPA: thermonuclease family protein [Acetobacteraceae bacterium]|nr:thermonuclease family protein [Acetobacteraceae bacterium]